MKQNKAFTQVVLTAGPLLGLLFWLCMPVAQAQPYIKTNGFTTNEGLASNHVYDMLEDSKGFLWAATDNGISRFDGKYFKNFSIKDGLPSNDVLQVLMETDGTVWVNCYKQPPAYFDAVNNRFITLVNNQRMNVHAASLLSLMPLASGGISFIGAYGSGLIKNKQLIAERKKTEREVDFFMDLRGELAVINCRKLLMQAGKKDSMSTTDNIRIILQGQFIDSFVFYYKNPVVGGKVYDNRMYIPSDSQTIHRISDIRISPLRYNMDSVSIAEELAGYKVCGKQLCITGKQGTVYIFNTASLALQHKVPTGHTINSSYTDSHGNLWIATLDQGLLLYKNNGIRKLEIPENLIKSNFLSLASNANGELFAGNYFGQVLQVSGAHYTKHDIPGRPAAWVRKTICIGKKLVAIHDEGYSINFNKSKAIYFNNGFNLSLKTATAINDSIIMLGSIQGLTKLNVNTMATTLVNNIDGRTLSLVKATGNSMYYIGPQGLYKYCVDGGSTQHVPLNNYLKNDKPSSLAFAQDSSLWVATSAGNILVLMQDSVRATIPNSSGLPENITSMMAYKNNVWMGSKTGIAVVQYGFRNKAFQYNIFTISKTDGLPSNTVNELLACNDMVYAATENGIAIIPANYMHKYVVSPQLVAVRVNEQPIPIALSYRLQSHQNSIALEFAGVELSGHFKNLQYAIDGDNHFTQLLGNTLNLQLASGSHTLYVKAVDANYRTGSDLLAIHFDIATPFYRSFWFMALAMLLFTSLAFWLYTRRKLNKQRIAFAQQLALEKQRNKITADLHDDIGASLSSLQVNSAVANQLMNKDAAKAQKVLDKIESQSKDLADKIGDIIWSMKPGKDEFMTMSSRIKNFANDILGATNMLYEIEIDKELDSLVKDITTRKNIVFITKEAINNAVKYSQATHVFVQLKKVQQHIVLVVSDSGTGFTQDEKVGNGIANMKKRAEELGGSFNMQSTVGKGTMVTCRMPLFIQIK